MLVVMAGPRVVCTTSLPLLTYGCEPFVCRTNCCVRFSVDWELELECIALLPIGTPVLIDRYRYRVIGNGLFRFNFTLFRI